MPFVLVRCTFLIAINTFTFVTLPRLFALVTLVLNQTGFVLKHLTDAAASRKPHYMEISLAVGVSEIISDTHEASVAHLFVLNTGKCKRCETIAS